MKHLLVVIICLFNFNAFSQKTALLARDFKKPVLFTDSITVEQVKTGYFPVQLEDMDTLYASLDYLAEMLTGLKRAKMKSFEFRAGKTTIKTFALPYAYGDKFEIVAVTRLNEIESIFTITSKKNNNSNNSKRLRNLMAYLESNKAWFKKTYQIKPKFYNIVVIAE